jgi:hypothetical protein
MNSTAQMANLLQARISNQKLNSGEIEDKFKRVVHLTDGDMYNPIVQVMIFKLNILIERNMGHRSSLRAIEREGYSKRIGVFCD